MSKRKSPSSASKKTSKMQKKETGATNSTVAFLGAEGSFTEQASHDYFEKVKNVKFSSQSTLAKVFDAVSEGKCEFGVVPIENSETGSFRRVYDLLIAHPLFIVGECALQEEHCLMASKGVKKGDISQVYSHPAVFDQCGSYLSKLEEENKTELLRVVKSDTAGACKLLSDGKHMKAAAIASKRAAKLYDLAILDSKIADDAGVATRYVVLSWRPATVTSRENLRTSMALSLQNEPGSMFRLLSCFRFRDINILKMETRPSSSAASSGVDMFKVHRHWEYVFYIDCETPRDAPKTKALLDNLGEYCLNVRDLGTYQQNLPKLEWQGCDTSEWSLLID